MDRSTPGFPVHHQLLELAEPMSIESVMPSNHLVLCCPLLLLPSIFPSIRVFSNKSALRIRWPKYCSFSFSISHSNEYSGKEKESEVAQSCPTLCHPTNRSTPSFPVHHQLLELAQTHVHRVSDALKSYLKTKYGYPGTCTG